MSEYHKIHSLFLRDEKSKFKNFLSDGDGFWHFSKPEFRYLAKNNWVFTEKVDGTNVRIYWEPGTKTVQIKGRTESAQMPTFLFQKLTEMFTPEKFAPLFDYPIVLHGEGYGAKIQKGGGNYISDGCSFILFDVWIGNFLERENVVDIAKKLDIQFVPIVGTGTLTDMVDLVRCKEFWSRVSTKVSPEGIVARPETELYSRRGERIITKLKVKDFTNMAAKGDSEPKAGLQHLQCPAQYQGAALKYLKQFVTKDGVRGPLESVPEERIFLDYQRAVVVSRITELVRATDLHGMSTVRSRPYELVAQEPAVILTYKEQ